MSYSATDFGIQEWCWGETVIPLAELVPLHCPSFANNKDGYKILIASGLNCDFIFSAYNPSSHKAYLTHGDRYTALFYKI